MKYVVNKALIDVLKERVEQVEKHDYDDVHDDKYLNAQLTRAGVHYAAAAASAIMLKDKSYAGLTPLTVQTGFDWPWPLSFWKTGPIRKMLIKAAALIIAEIERIDRIEAKKEEGK